MKKEKQKKIPYKEQEKCRKLEEFSEEKPKEDNQWYAQSAENYLQGMRKAIFIALTANDDKQANLEIWRS